MGHTRDSILGHGASTSLDKSESVEAPAVSEHTLLMDGGVVRGREVRGEFGRGGLGLELSRRESLGIDAVVNREWPYYDVGHDKEQCCTSLGCGGQHKVTKSQSRNYKFWTLQLAMY